MTFFGLSDQPAAARVRLRPAIHVAPVDQGLLVIGWQSRMIVSGGPALHGLWSALEPHLEAGAELDVLVRGLPDRAREVARALLLRLDEADALIPVGDPTVAAPGSRSIRRLVEFLASAAPAPEDARRAIATAAVTVWGSGRIAERTAGLLLENGVGEVHVSAEVGAAVSASAEHPEHGVIVVSPGPVGRTDVLVAVDDGAARVTGPLVVPDGGVLAGVPQIDVLSTRDRVLVLPPVADGDARDATLASMRRRGVDVRPAAAPRTVALVAAAHVAVQVLYTIAGIATETDGQAVCVSADRLRISHHPVWRGAGGLTTRVRPEDLVRYDPAHLTRLTDELTGLLPEPLPESWPQVPFAVLRASDGAFGHGITSAAARFRAALESGRLLIAEELGTDSSTTSAAGADYREFVVDGFSRLLARALASGSAGGVLVDVEVPRDDTSRPRVHAARHRLASVLAGEPSPTFTHHRLVRDPDLASVVSARRSDGSLVALALGADPEDALVRALDHAAARTQAGGAGGAVPQLALGWSADEETRAWNGDLDRLARALVGAPLGAVRAERVGAQHPLAGLGVFGALHGVEVMS
jgi:hypothetical protein